MPLSFISQKKIVFERKFDVIMELAPDVTCGLHLEAKNIEEKCVLMSQLGKIAKKTDSFIKVSQLDDSKRFSREKYFRELQSQLSMSSGYSSFESLSSFERIQRSALLQSQALSIICQLEETVENKRIVSELQSDPWKFHHTMQLLDWENSRVFAKQDFYEISPELPLVNVSLHANRTVIRYNLFVKSLRRMRRFYEEVLQIYPCFVADDYCCFVLKSTDIYELQFSLKRSRHLDIFVARNSHLLFEIPRNDSLLGRLTNKAVIETCDPEGNPLVLLTGPDIETSSYARSCSLQRTDSSRSQASSTLVGDCSLIRTRRKTSNRSTSESESSSGDSLFSQDGIIYSGCPIVL